MENNSKHLSLVLVIILLVQLLIPLPNVLANEVEAPTNVTATEYSPANVRIDWDYKSGISQYRVYEVSSGSPQLLTEVSTNRAVFRNMEEGSYTFAVSAVSNGVESVLSNSVQLEIIYPEMQAPGNFTYIIRNGNDIQLRWDSAENAQEYKIYQIIDGQKTLITTTSNTNYTLRNMPEDFYSFEITSFNSLFGESNSAPLELTLIHPEMQPPTGLNALIRNGNDILLRWDDAEHAQSYNIYQVIDNEKILVRTNSTTSYTFRNMEAGVYEYEVSSYSDRFGESFPAKLIVELEHPEIQPPTGLNALIRNGNDILLRWDEAEHAQSYNIYQIVDDERVLVRTNTTLSYTLRDMAEGIYEIEVTSYSDRFGESFPAKITVELNHPEIQPPTGLNALIRNGNDILLRWDEAEHAQSYNIYQVVNDERILIRSNTTTSYTLRDMAEGIYDIEVTSYSDRFGESFPASLSVELIHPVMQPPTGLNALIRNGNDILLRWDEAEFATGYEVYEVVNGEYILLTTLDRTSYNMVNVAEGTHTYAVKSLSDRFGKSDQYTELVVDLVYPTMQPPTGFKATINNGNDILLRWNASEFANGYVIYQIVDGLRQELATTDKLSLNRVNQPEGTYTFEIVSFSDRFGQSSGVQTTATVVFPEVDVPVLTLKSVNDSNAVLSWKAITGISKYNIYELIDGEAAYIGITDKVSYTVTNIADGAHQYVITAVHDRFGESNHSNSVTVEIISDITPPETTSNITDGWLHESFVVELTATDDESGVDKTYYAVNGSVYSEGTSFVISEEGVHQISYYSVDVAGNVEEVKTESVKVDLTAPVTTSNITDTWLNGEFTVELTAEDNLSGVAQTFYSINNGEFTEGSSFVIGEEGVHQVSYYSVDVAGNVEETKTETVKVDVTAPVTTSNITDTWLNREFAVELTAEDNLSGVAQTFYSINNGEFTEGTSFVISEEGIHQVSYYSVDVAGNVEETKTETVKVDLTAPETTSNISDTWLKGEFTVELTAEDNLSGVAQTFYSINNGEFIEGTSFVISEEGIHQVSYYSVDVAGNVEEVNMAEVKIDKTAPTVTLDYLEEYALGTQLELTYTAEDNLSGIAQEVLLFNGTEMNKGDVVTLDQPGSYTINVSVTDHAGWTTLVEHTIVVYIHAEIEVTPKVLQPNDGVFTVRVSLPSGYSTNGFELETVTLEGVSAINKSKGSHQQAKQGMFKFERNDFEWNGEEVILEFRGMVNGQLVVGYATVKVQTNGSNDKESKGKK